MSAGGQGGTGLVGVLAGLAGLFLLISIAAWSLQATRSRRSVEAAAHRLAASMRRAAVRAVASGRSSGLAFAGTGNGEPVVPLEDVAGDGLGRDDAAGPPLALRRDFPGAGIAPCPWPDVAAIPPGRRRLRREDPPVRFGRERIVSFTPSGHATAGHVTISDGRAALCAVVVTGATARIRTLCYERGEDRWRER